MVEYIADFFRRLYEETGWNFIVFYEQYEAGRFIQGMGVSLQLIVYSLLLSFVIGIIGAWLQASKNKPIRWFVSSYIQIFRNTPPLIQLLFFYFVLGNLFPTYDAGGYQQAYIGSFGWAVISLSFFAGSFNVEIFRSGIESVPKATGEAAEALGYTRLGAYIHIVLPLAFRFCLPALNNNMVNLLKTTTLAYVIAVPEMMYMSNQIWSDNVNVTEMMLLMFIYYVGLVGILVWFMHKWERKMRIPGYG